MSKLFTIMERFAPEAIDIMETRYQVLHQILHQQPVGRRQLGKSLGFSERVVRSEVDMLKGKGLLQSTPAGIYLTSNGEEMLREIDEIVPWLFNLQSLAEQLKNRFALDDVVIVPGDSFSSNFTREDLGRAAAEYLRKNLYPGCILAVTGGTTLAEMARAMRPGINMRDICVVPARGGLGENVETQAGNIAARIADTIGAQYRLLHIPDNLEESTAKALKKDVHINEVLKLIKSADILFHGIGPANEMAVRRGLSPKEIAFLEENEGMAEALRYYFDRRGRIILEMPGIGLETDDLKNIKKIVAVAGGSNKAEAIKAVLKHNQENVLITDEGAAQQIINGNKEGSGNHDENCD